MSALYGTYARSNLAFERGEGVRLYAQDGTEYLDFHAGVAVNALGHGDPHMVAALKAAAEGDMAGVLGYSDEPLVSMDYKEDPLYAGDFLYLFAGDSGSFEHMLVVSRVDEDGRAYAVTNLKTPEGMVISEAMLYDPNKPGIGQFYEWTNRANDALGRTGYGGYWLWRLKTPLP